MTNSKKETAGSVAVNVDFINVGSPSEVVNAVKRLNSFFSDSQVYEEEGHQRTYRRIAHMLHLANQVNDPHNLDICSEYLKLAEQRGLRTPKKDENPFLLDVRMLDGEELSKPGEDFKFRTVNGVKATVAWQPNRSSEKYAAVMRWADDEGINPTELVGRINDFVDPQTKLTKIDGIIAVDRKRHGGQVRKVKTYGGEERRIAIQKMDEICFLPVDDPNAFHVNEEGYALAVLHREKDGQWAVLYDAGLDQTLIWKGVREGFDALGTREAAASSAVANDAALQV